LLSNILKQRALMRYSASMPCPPALSSYAPERSRFPALAAGEDEGEGVDNGAGGSGGQGQVGLATRTRTRPKKPQQYKVLMLNDDYTPMEFVVMVLKRFFRMDLEQATRVMRHVHQ
jgi:ATP-dependent Clp protease adaptor protein ClpS